MTDFVTPPVWSGNDVPLSVANMKKHSDNENYFKEVLAGTNSDKIPGAAMNRQNAIWNYTYTESNTPVAWGHLIVVGAQGGNRTITLPTSTLAGQILIVKKWDATANTVTIVPQSGQYIDGAASFTLYSQFDSVTLMADGGADVMVV